jgi:small subunit ribosomal protein S27e
MAKKTPKTESSFLRVKCNDCGNEQIIFEKAASKIKCLACDKLLAEPSGGKALIKTQVLGPVDRDV